MKNNILKYKILRNFGGLEPPHPLRRLRPWIGGQRRRLSEQGAGLMAAAMVSAAVRSCSVGLLYMSRTTRADTFGSDVGGFQGSPYAGESSGQPAESR